MTKPNIYLIDDDPVLLNILKKKLGKLGEVKVFSDEKEGLTKVISDRPDIVVIDLNMPTLNGDEMMIKFSEEKIFKTTQIVLLTGEVMSDIKKMSLFTLGFAAIIEKHEGINKVIEVVGKTIEEYGPKAS